MGLKRKPPEENVRLVSSNGRSICGVFTNKIGRLVQFESWAERALLLRLDRAPEIVDYASQPEQFEYMCEGKPHIYTPDFKVWWQSGEIEIHEVTMSARQSRPEIRQRAEAAGEICQARGWRYIVHTEKSLPQPTELANLLALFRYRPRAYANRAVTQVAFEQLGDKEQATPLRAFAARLARELGLPQPTIVAGLGHLLWHGKIITDLNKLLFVDGGLAPGAVVWINPDQGDRP